MRFDFIPATTRRTVLGVLVFGFSSTLVLSTTSGCNKKPPPEREYRISGRVIEVPRGRTFAIRLASEPTSGYQWQIQEPIPTGTILELMDQTYDQSAGEQVFNFRAAGAGAVQVPFKYVRTGAPRTSPGRTETFRVVVD